jgi:hypothetical protein
MTVTGVTVPSAAKICVIPTFLPMIPLIITNPQFSVFGFQFSIISQKLKTEN